MCLYNVSCVCVSFSFFRLWKTGGRVKGKVRGMYFMLTFVNVSVCVLPNEEWGQVGVSRGHVVIEINYFLLFIYLMLWCADFFDRTVALYLMLWCCSVFRPKTILCGARCRFVYLFSGYPCSIWLLVLNTQKLQG